MIPLSPFLSANWRAIAALLVVGALAGLALWYRGAAAVAEAGQARAERDLAEMTGGYNLLAGAVQRQNAAVNEWEQKATEAAQRGAKARTEAKPVVVAAQKSADALAGAMRGLRPAECPTKDAVRVVREDLGSLR